MSAKHTPGPWNAAGKHITQDDGGIVAYVTAYAAPTPRQLADARLIAAAPELLEALQVAYDALLISYPLHSCDMDKRFLVLNRARAAIAKAAAA